MRSRSPITPHAQRATIGGDFGPQRRTDRQKGHRDAQQLGLYALQVLEGVVGHVDGDLVAEAL